jgi:hypothetical protein
MRPVSLRSVFLLIAGMLGLNVAKNGRCDDLCRQPDGQFTVLSRRAAALVYLPDDDLAAGSCAGRWR